VAAMGFPAFARGAADFNMEKAMKKFLIGLSFAFLCAGAWALPTVQQVEAQVQQGHYAQAESMMKDVVEAKPGSAKGHYIYAELLAHNGNFAKAAAEAAKAKEIDPGIKFADPEKFRSFEQLLQREQNPRPRTESPSALSPVAAAPALTQAASPSSGVPTWVWGAGLAVIAWLLWRGFSRSRGTGQGAVPGAAMPSAGSGYGYGSPAAGMPGTPYGAPVAPAPGGGLLHTGAAVAGGLAAGMLVDELLHRNQPGGLGGLGGNDQLSGLQRGMFDAPRNDSAANELENRNVDFGNGADWDSGGGSSDSGSSADDGSGGGWD
jgi:hypothetical protein